MSHIKIPSSLLPLDDLEAAIRCELGYGQPYMPPSVVVAASRGHEDELKRLCGGRYRNGLQIPSAEVVQVPKRGGGMRPVVVLDLEARVLYRALVRLLEQYLEPLDRSFDVREAVSRAPLSVDGCTHIVVADIAGFYDFVDHSMLEEEVVARTGEGEIAELVSAALSLIMGRRFGLPQVFHPSDVLSEVFIDIAERRLVRQGVHVFRYIDDFRIASDSWIGANDDLAALQSEARRLGLILNEFKTYTLTRARYETWLDEPSRRWDEIEEAVDVDLRGASAYEAAEVTEEADAADEGAGPEVDEQRVTAAAAQALEMALHPEETSDRLQVEVNRQLASVSLQLLTRAKAPGGLGLIRDFVSREPQHTNIVARYLRALVDEHQGDVTEAIEDLIADEGVYLSPWQSLWIIQAARELPEMGDEIAGWIDSIVNSSVPDSIRARGALALAEEDRIDPQSVADLYRESSRASQPDLVAALASLEAAEADPLLETVRRESEIHGWVIDWVRGP